MSLRLSDVKTIIYNFNIKKRIKKCTSQENSKDAQTIKQNHSRPGSNQHRSML